MRLIQKRRIVSICYSSYLRHCNNVLRKQFLQENVPLGHLLKEDTLLMSWRGSAINEVNDWDLRMARNTRRRMGLRSSRFPPDDGPASLRPHMPASMGRSWPGWSRITWNACFDWSHSWTASTSRWLGRLSRSRNMATSTCKTI